MLRIVAFMILAAIVVPRAFGQPSTNRIFAFPPLGLGSTETAQISVVNNSANAGNGTAASCTGTILFMDANGANLGSPNQFTVTSGQIFSVSLPFASSGATGTRTQIGGRVTLTQTASDPKVPCALDFSFQTFDTATGASHVLLGSSIPQPPRD